MLRALVALFLGLNVLLFVWMRANPTWGEAEREPQRLQRQVSPAAIQVLPDLPASAASAPVASAFDIPSGFAPPAAGLPAAAHASAAMSGSVAHPASAPVHASVTPARASVAAARRPSGATPTRSAGSR